MHPIVWMYIARIPLLTNNIEPLNIGHEIVATQRVEDEPELGDRVAYQTC